MQKTGNNVYRWSCVVVAIQVGFHGAVAAMSAMMIVVLLTGVEIDEEDCRNIRLNPQLLILPFFFGFQVFLALLYSDLYKAVSGRKATSKVISKIWMLTVMNLVFIALALMLVWNPNAYEVYFPRVGVYPYLVLDLSLYLALLSLVNARIMLDDKAITKKAPIALPDGKQAVAIDIEIVVKPEEGKGKIETDENANEEGKAFEVKVV